MDSPSLFSDGFMSAPSSAMEKASMSPRTHGFCASVGSSSFGVSGSMAAKEYENSKFILEQIRNGKKREYYTV